MDFELTRHAQDVMKERGIDLPWIERVAKTPEKKERDESDEDLEHHLGKIKEYGNRVLRVVINVSTNPQRVVTVYFDRKMRGKL